MKIGFEVPLRGPMARPEGLDVLARGGEEMGFDIIGVSDRIIVPRAIGSRYPYSETGAFPGSVSGESVEQLATLSFLASRTITIRLLTSILVLPHRNPVLAAKMLATVDVLSGGRLIVGCGVGWMREEFETIQAPPFGERGVVADEYIEAFKELWTSDDPSFDGKYVSFSDIGFDPKPVQEPHPPLWIGGESPAALRRAARLGDGWYPIGNNPRYLLDTLERMSHRIARLRRECERAGRDLASLDIAYQAPVYDVPEPRLTADGDRVLFTGTSEQVAGGIRSFEELGVNTLVLDFVSDTVDGTLARMDTFTASVRPLLTRHSESRHVGTTRNPV